MRADGKRLILLGASCEVTSSRAHGICKRRSHLPPRLDGAAQGAVAKFGGQALPQQDGGRLQAAVDQPQAVQVNERLRHLCGNAHARLRLQHYRGAPPAGRVGGALTAQGVVQAAVLRASQNPKPLKGVLPACEPSQCHTIPDASYVCWAGGAASMADPVVLVRLQGGGL